MNWRITTFETHDQANATPQKRTLKVQSGRHTKVFNGEDTNLPACTAVACVRPERLALVLGSAAGVQLNGRPVSCPVVVIDTRGGKLSLRTRGHKVMLEVSCQAAPVFSADGSGVCCLCRDPLTEGVAAQCSRCGRRFHSDCVEVRLTGRGCPACSRPIKQR